MSETVFNDAVNVKGQMTVDNINITGSTDISGTSNAFRVTNTTDATAHTSTTASISTAGGLAVEKTIHSADAVFGTTAPSGSLASEQARFVHSGVVGIGIEKSGSVLNSIGINSSDNLVVSLGNSGSFIFQSGQSDFSVAGTTRATLSSTQLSIPLSTASSSSSTGALVVTGGAGIGGSLNIEGSVGITTNLSITGNITSGTWNGSTIGVAYGGTGATSLTDNAVLLGAGTGAIEASAMSYSSSTLSVLNVSITGTTASTNTTTGALTVAGGAGISGAVYTGGAVYTTGNVGIGTTVANAQLQLSNTIANRKVVLYDATNNDHQFVGLGIGATELRYQVSGTSSDHIFYAATSSTTSSELLRVIGTGGIQTAFVRGGSGSGDNLVLRSTSNVTKGQVYVDESTSSSSTTTGALRVNGGVGIGGRAYIGAGLSVSGGDVDINHTTPLLTIRNGTAGGIIYFGNSSHGVGRGASIGTLTDSNDVSLWTSGTGSIGLATLSTQRLTIGTTGIVSLPANISSSSTTTGTLVVTGGVGISGATYIGGALNTLSDVVLNSGSNIIRRDTADGTDDGYLELTGGGATGASRGGRVVVSGNERATHGGRVQLYAGGTSDIQFLTNSDTLYGSISGTDGTMSLVANVDSTSASSGTLKITGGLGVTGSSFIQGSIVSTIGRIYNTNDDTSIAPGAELGLVKKASNITKLVSSNGNAITLATSDVGDIRTGNIGTATLTDRLSVLSTGQTSVLSTDNATSTSTGALRVSGGVGIANDLHVGGTITGSIKTSVISKITPIYLRGAGANNIANQLVKVGGTTHVDTANVGLTLTIINASTHALVSTTAYDTSTSGTASDNLATAIGNLDRQRIGILTSYSSFTGSITSNLRTAVRRLGLYKLSETTTVNTAYCAIFRGQGTADPNTERSNQVIEYLSDADADSDYALVSTYLIDDSINIDTLPSALVSPNPTASIPAVYVNNSGQVGINTITPGFSLDVSGDVRSTGYVSAQGAISGSNATAGVYIGLNGTSAGLELNSSNTSSTPFIDFTSTSVDKDGRIIYDLSTDKMSFETNSTERMFINNTQVSISATTASSSTITGALVVSGGAGVGGNIYIGGNSNLGTVASGTWNGSTIGVAYGGTGATSLTDNAVLLGAGTGAIEASAMSYASSTLSVLNVSITGTTASTSTITGALTVGGGVGISGAVYTGGAVYTTGNVGIGTTTANAQLQLSNTTANRKVVLYDINNNDHQFTGLGIDVAELRYQIASTAADHIFYAGTSSTTSNELLRVIGTGGIQTALVRGGSGSGDNLVLRSTSNATKGQVWVDESTSSTSTTTGALRVSGGVGIAGDVFAGGHVFAGGEISGGNASAGAYIGRSGTSGAIELVCSNTSSSPYIDFTSTAVDTDGRIIYDLSANDFSIGTDGSSRVLIGNTRVHIQQTTTSTSTITGALRVSGGAGIAGALFTGGNITIDNDTSPTLTVKTTSGSDGQIYFGNSGHGIGRNSDIGSLTGGNDVSVWTTTGSIGLATNGTQRLIVDSGGAVSISTDLTAATLQVNTFKSISSQGCHIQWNRSSGGGETKILNQVGAGSDNAVYISSSTTSNVVTDWAKFSGAGLVVYTGSNQTFDPTFRVNGPGIDDPGSLTVNIGLDVVNNIKTAGVYGNSDARLKHNVKSVRDHVDYSRFIEEVDGKMFQWISDGDSGVQNCGYIAQDLVKRGFGGLVIGTSDDAIQETVDEDGFVSPAGTRMSINYSNIIPILHENIRDLKRENIGLKHTVEMQNMRIDQLEEKVAFLLSKLA